MTHIIRLAEAVTITPRTDIEVVRLVEAAKAHGPQIIRTVEELEALDPDTVLTLYTWEEAGIWSAAHFQKRFEDNGHIPDLPATVIATGSQVRAARQALEEEDV